MKKIIFALAGLFTALAVVLAVLFLVPKTFLRGVSAEDVSEITVFDGGTGYKFTITDASEIGSIVENLNTQKMRRSGISSGRDGFNFSLTFKDAEGNVIEKFIVDGRDKLRCDPFYYTPEQELCYNLLLELEDKYTDSKGNWADRTEPEIKPEIPETSSSKLEQLEYNGIKYWVYLPAGVSENMPMIVYLHGDGGIGPDPNRIFEAESLPRYIKEGLIVPSAIVLMPQLANENTSWKTEMLNVAGLVRAVAGSYKVDQSHIGITGHGLGAGGALTLAANYPDIFSAVAALSGSTTLNDATFEALGRLSVWAIVGDEDTVVDPSLSMALVNGINAREQRVPARFNALEGYTHERVPEAYLDSSMAILDWLVGR